MELRCCNIPGTWLCYLKVPLNSLSEKVPAVMTLSNLVTLPQSSCSGNVPKNKLYAEVESTILTRITASGGGVIGPHSEDVKVPAQRAALLIRSNCGTDMGRREVSTVFYRQREGYQKSSSEGFGFFFIKSSNFFFLLVHL